MEKVPTYGAPENLGMGGDANLAKRVVLNMVHGLENKSHVLIMDNYFNSIALFQNLLERGIYATGIMKNNRVGLPHFLCNTKECHKNVQGTFDWQMHESRSLSCVVWKDKRPVLLLSNHSKPIVFEGKVVPSVPQRNGEEKPMIETSPLHLEYTTSMRSIDIAHHLCSNHSSQARTHKWWHQLFYFLLNLITTNMYIMYMTLWKIHCGSERSLTHLQFLNEMCKALTQKWLRKNDLGMMDLLHVPTIHVPIWKKLRRRCNLCKKKCQYYCYLCNYNFLCFFKVVGEKSTLPSYEVQNIYEIILFLYVLKVWLNSFLLVEMLYAIQVCKK